MLGRKFKVVTVSLSEAEWTLIKGVAEKEGKSLVAFMRATAIGKAQASQSREREED